MHRNPVPISWHSSPLGFYGFENLSLAQNQQPTPKCHANRRQQDKALFFTEPRHLPADALTERLDLVHWGARDEGQLRRHRVGNRAGVAEQRVVARVKMRQMRRCLRTPLPLIGLGILSIWSLLSGRGVVFKCLSDSNVDHF